MSTALTALASRLRELGATPEKIAKEAAGNLKKSLSAEIGASLAPDGSPWELTKAGKRPLQRAASHVSVTAEGTSIVVLLEGPEVLHHTGKARGHVVRKVIPDGQSPGLVIAAVELAVTHIMPGVLNG